MNREILRGFKIVVSPSQHKIVVRHEDCLSEDLLEIFGWPLNYEGMNMEEVLDEIWAHLKSFHPEELRNMKPTRSNPKITAFPPDATLDTIKESDVNRSEQGSA